VDQGTVNSFEVTPIDLQLNPLDNEVFVVTAVRIDFLGSLPLPNNVLGPTTTLPFAEVGCTTTRPSIMPTMGNTNCFAYASRAVAYGVSQDASGANELTAAAVFENNSNDVPDAMLDYIAIIATSDFFISINTDGYLVTPADTQDVAVRVYGYRAKADAATYAALVQSEVLSS
jgi:hypothetical protein